MFRQYFKLGSCPGGRLSHANDIKRACNAGTRSAYDKNASGKQLCACDVHAALRLEEGASAVVEADSMPSIESTAVPRAALRLSGACSAFAISRSKLY